jgi:hypothetical protein
MHFVRLFAAGHTWGCAYDKKAVATAIQRLLEGLAAAENEQQQAQSAGQQ